MLCLHLFLRLSLIKASTEKLISEVEVVANMETWLDEKKIHFREIQRDQAEEKLDELEVFETSRSASKPISLIFLSCLSRFSPTKRGTKWIN